MHYEYIYSEVEAASKFENTENFVTITEARFEILICDYAEAKKVEKYDYLYLHIGKHEMRKKRSKRVNT